VTQERNVSLFRENKKLIHQTYKLLNSLYIYISSNPEDICGVDSKHVISEKIGLAGGMAQVVECPAWKA
jgi:hypothetical protein